MPAYWDAAGRSPNAGHTHTVIQRQIDAADRQIDQLVYELYCLADDEIALVEEATQQVPPAGLNGRRAIVQGADLGTRQLTTMPKPQRGALGVGKPLRISAPFQG